MMTKIKNWLMVAAGVVFAALVFVFQRRGTEIDRLKNEAVRDRMGHDVTKLKEELDDVEKRSSNDSRTYDELKRGLSPELAKIIDFPTPKRGDPGPNAS